VTSQHPCPNPHTNPYNTPDFAVYGFWIKDPLVTGIGQNTYKTADECQTTYFQPLVTSDSYNGLFLQIAEPPAAPSDASVEVQVPIPDIGNLIFIGADTTSFSYSGSKQASSIMQASAITGYPTRSYSFNKKSWKDIVDPSILLDPEAVSCFEGTSMGKPILVQRIDKANADYYLVPFGRRDKRLGFIANAVVVLDSKMGYFKEASWTNIAEKFLKVEEKDAKCLVRRYLIKERLAALRQLYNDMINSIRRNPKQAAQFRRIYQLSVSRLHQQYAQLLKYLTSKCAKLLWRPGEYSKTPYRPYWQISAGTKVFYVTQEGKVYLGSKAKSIF
jgi:hypothetical protein